MKRSNINFAHSSTLFGLPQEIKAKILVLALLLLGLGLSGSTAFSYIRLKHNQEQLAQNLNARQQTLAKAAQKNSIAAPLLAKGQAQGINRAIWQLNFPWSEILDAFQAVSTAQTALLSLEPNAEKQLVRALAESPNPDVMFAYLQSLRDTGAFTRIELVRYEVNEQDPMKPLRFSVDAYFSTQELSLSKAGQS